MEAVKKLIRGLKRGSQTAFEQLLELYSEKVYHTAFHMLSNEEDANDAAQETFLAIYKSIGRFRAESSLSTWIYKITVNTCINLARKNQKHATVPMEFNAHGELVDLQLPDTAPTPEEAVIGKVSYEEVRHAIDQLGGEHRTVIVLRDIENLSYEEIAQIVNLPQGTVKSRINRARSQLRQIILKNRELFNC